MNPLLLVDSYKINHYRMYPEGMTKLYSNLTPRKSRMKNVDKIVVFGVQHFILEYLINRFNNEFFNKGRAEVLEEYFRHCGVDHAHIGRLHELGYLPIEIKALEEGTLCPIGVPMLTITNTHPDFGWLVNYLETLLSCELWQPITSATIAYEYKKLLIKYAKETDEKNVEFVNWQGHDFSMRGMSSSESAILSGMGHLLSFTGTDTIPAIYQLEKSYHAVGLIGASVPATEHSVMCMGKKESEVETFKRLLELYPLGILSVVSDTWDLWYVLTVILPQLKEQILARDGKLVIRPDSGNPVDILCGTNTSSLYKDISKYWEGEPLVDTEQFEEHLLEEVREDTPHGECGVEEHTGYYIINGKFYKATIHNISWNRHDKQYYFIDMWQKARITVEEIPVSPQIKGVIELLWDIFGGTVNEQGYKVLNPHIGAIYGDSITLERAEQICERLKAKGFASTNVVLGIGSYTYQYNTRDTFGFAMKATYGEVTYTRLTPKGTVDIKEATSLETVVECREIFKDPVTDDGTKKSKKGLLMIGQVENPHVPENGEIWVKDQCTWEEESGGLLKTVFKDGKLTKSVTLQEIRNKLNEY